MDEVKICRVMVSKEAVRKLEIFTKMNNISRNEAISKILLQPNNICRNDDLKCVFLRFKIKYSHWERINIFAKKQKMTLADYVDEIIKCQTKNILLLSK